MATTVHVKNISKDTNESKVRDFFSFCGKIQSLSVTPDGTGQTAAVTFEKPTAAKTALLLDNTQLGPNTVTVTSESSLEELSSDKSGHGGEHDPHATDVAQEDKPRSRIFAEYLAQGYVISDKAIERALALDTQHGISSRFTNALQQFDSKFKATENAQAVDQKYKLTDKANAGWRSMNSYFEKALGTPSGQRVHAFYQNTSKQVLDVHTEARRLADMKNDHLEHIPGTDSTRCGCQGDGGSCLCQPGHCMCASCPKNSDVKPTADAEKMNLHETEKGRTACNCGGKDGICACKPGECACGDCSKNPDQQASSSTTGAASTATKT